MAETIIVELGTKHFQEANAAVRAALAEAYKDEPFVFVAPKGVVPHMRLINFCVSKL